MENNYEAKHVDEEFVICTLFRPGSVSKIFSHYYEEKCVNTDLDKYFCREKENLKNEKDLGKKILRRYLQLLKRLILQ